MAASLLEAVTLLEELQGLGVALTVTADGERLHWKAKKGMLTDELRAALIRHKAGLLDLLPLVDRQLRTQARDLVAQMYTPGLDPGLV